MFVFLVLVDRHSFSPFCNQHFRLVSMQNSSESAMGFHKSTLVARGADTQLDPSCVSAPLATNVDLFACFPERLFKSSFSYI